MTIKCLKRQSYKNVLFWHLSRLPFFRHVCFKMCFIFWWRSKQWINSIIPIRSIFPFSCIFSSLFLLWWFAICFRFRNKLLFLDVIFLFELFDESMKITHTYKEYDLYAHKLKHSISVHKCNATRHQPNHKELNGKIKTAQVVQKGEKFLWNYTFVCMFVWYGCFAPFFFAQTVKV